MSNYIKPTVEVIKFEQDMSFMTCSGEINPGPGPHHPDPPGPPHPPTPPHPGPHGPHHP